MNTYFPPSDINCFKAFVEPVKPAVTPRVKKQKATELFNKFGIEPTFALDVLKMYPAFKKKSWRWIFENTEGILEDMNRNLLSDFPWMNKSYIDSSLLEIPSPILRMPKLLKDYDKLQKDLLCFNIVPSSEFCLEAEGGCHINVNLQDIKDKNLVEKTMQYLQLYLLNNPCIVWAFTSYMDTDSSSHSYDNIYCLCKGDFFTLRQGDGDDVPQNCPEDISHVELRFFCMPYTTRQLAHNINFAQKLLRFCYEQAEKGYGDDIYVATLREMDIHLCKTTLTEQMKKLKKVCKDIGYPYSKLVKHENVLNLAMRIASGKNNLI